MHAVRSKLADATGRRLPNQNHRCCCDGGRRLANVLHASPSSKLGEWCCRRLPETNHLIRCERHHLIASCALPARRPMCRQGSASPSSASHRLQREKSAIGRKGEALNRCRMRPLSPREALVATSHKRTTRSYPAEAAMSPRGENAPQRTRSVCYRHVLCRDARSHSMISLSCEPAIARLPSGEAAMSVR